MPNDGNERTVNALVDRHVRRRPHSVSARSNTLRT